MLTNMDDFEEQRVFIDCPNCGCKDFGIIWAGPHIKAICKSCGDTYRNRQSLVQFVKQGEDIDYSESERATEKQTNYIKFLANKHSEDLPKELAGEIISLFMKIEK